MCLSSIGNPAWKTIRGVRFAMRYGPTLVAVLITHSALEDIEHIPCESGGPLARFEKHRDAFERAASTKYQRGQLEDDGVVVVQPSDLKSTDR